jgi:glycerol-3-phosphate dehydrogenase (NAD(P)+)
MIAIAGAGAFGTALAIALARQGTKVTLWARDAGHVAAMQSSRHNTRYLGVVALPETVSVTAEIADLRGAKAILLAVPTQRLRGFLAEHGPQLPPVALVSCSKGMDVQTLQGPSAIISAARPDLPCALLTGPSFAHDIARGLPTALTLACADSGAEALQHLLSTPVLRLYRTDDLRGAELGGALKNVIAIAAGVAIGAGLGDSARAALITRGYAEMVRLATACGARAETLSGLSGLGDLVLTCTSQQSRNFRFGQALGAGTGFDPAVTVEGAATAKAAAELATSLGVDLPVATMVAALVEGRYTLNEALTVLLSRPLKQE